MALIEVLVGGIIGLTASLGGQHLGRLMDEEREERKLRRQKADELTNVILEHEYWLDRYRVSQHTSTKVELGSQPVAKARAIAAIYVPELKDSVAEFDLLSSNYMVWVTQKVTDRVNGRKVNLSEGFPEVYQPLARKARSIVDEAAKLAQPEPDKVRMLTLIRQLRQSR